MQKVKEMQNILRFYLNSEDTAHYLGEIITKKVYSVLGCFLLRKRNPQDLRWQWSCSSIVSILSTMVLWIYVLAACTFYYCVLFASLICWKGEKMQS